MANNFLRKGDRFLFVRRLGKHHMLSVANWRDLIGKILIYEEVSLMGLYMFGDGKKRTVSLGTTKDIVKMVFTGCLIRIPKRFEVSDLNMILDCVQNELVQNDVELEKKQV